MRCVLFCGVIAEALIYFSRTRMVKIIGLTANHCDGNYLPRLLDSTDALLCIGSSSCLLGRNSLPSRGARPSVQIPMYSVNLAFLLDLVLTQNHSQAPDR